MATISEHYHLYCYRFCRYFWIGWIMSMKLERPQAIDDDRTAFVYPRSWVDYVTIGFDEFAVLKRLRKQYEKLKNIH